MGLKSLIAVAQSRLKVGEPEKEIARWGKLER